MSVCPPAPGGCGRCEAAAAPPEEPLSVPIELERSFGSFPRQFFTLRKLARRLLGEGRPPRPPPGPQPHP